MTAPAPSFFRLYQGDARDLDTLLRHWSEESPLLTCTITSPPYGSLKNYGHPDQIGWGQSHDEYLAEMRRVFRMIARHTKDDGSLWLIADTLRPEDGSLGRLSRVELLPFQLEQQAREAGWVLRDLVVWVKDKTLPWSSKGRLRNGFEYILFFAKTDTFKYRVDRIREATSLEEWWVKWPERYHPQGKVPTNVWEYPIPLQGSWARTKLRHSCPLPADLVKRIVELSTDPGDVVFDPFAGSGVVVAESQRLGRRGLGIEIVKRNVDLFAKVVRPEILRTRGANDHESPDSPSGWLEETIRNLRALKYPKTLLQGLKRERPDLAVPRVAIVRTEKGVPKVRTENKWIVSDTLFLAEVTVGEAAELENAFRELASRRPASKFGITGRITVKTMRQVDAALLDERFFHYVNGRTWQSSGTIQLADALNGAIRRASIPPILGNVEVNERPRALGVESKKHARVVSGHKEVGAEKSKKKQKGETKMRKAPAKRRRASKKR